MKILIIGINYSPELTGIGKYTGEMAKWLAENGHECSVITSFPYYPHWKLQEPYSGRFYKKEVSENGKLQVYRCPIYIPKVPGGLKRIIHDASFFLSAFILLNYLLFKKRNEMVFCVAPPFHTGFLGFYYRLFRRSKVNYHIQDLQIDAARDLKMIRSGVLIRILFGMEKFILKRSESISSISTGMINKIHSKMPRRIIRIPNWVDTLAFYPLENREKLKEKWGFSKEDILVLYSGSIGEKQGLDIIPEIAEELSNNSRLRFIICGTGPYKSSLMKVCDEKKLNQVVFMPLQAQEVFNEFLNLADAHLVLQKAQAADLVMPSKLTTILAVGGLTIATASEGTSLYEEISNHNMGILTPPENKMELLNSLLGLKDGNHDIMRTNARAYAMKYLDINNIMKRMVEELNSGN